MDVLSVFVSTLFLAVSIEAQKTSNLPTFLVVSFDGFRNSFLTKSRTPLLYNLSLSECTTPYMEPVFPTKTFPNHQSICTGLYPSSHGIVDNIVYDVKYEATLDGKKNDRGFWNYDSKVLPLWIRNEQQGGVSGCHMWPGSTQGYGPNSDLRPTYYYPGYDENVSWKNRVKTVIEWMTNPNKPANLVFLYFNQPDSTAHKFGPFSPETLEQVESTDQRVAYLIRKLREKGIYDKINLLLLSDHGMKTVSSNRIIDLNKVVNARSLVKDVNGYSPVMQIVPRSGQRDELYNKLKDASKTGNFTVFRTSELCGAPYYYCNARRVHDYVTLADPGFQFKKLDLKKKRRKRDTKYWGSHGYVNTEETMRVFFIARGPAFKKGYKTEEPIKNLDIVPLISKVIGIKGVPTNGSLARVQDMLK